MFTESGPGLYKELKAECWVLVLNLESGKTADHVTRQEITSGIARGVDRHAVVIACTPRIVHVGVEPSGESCGFAHSSTNLISEW